MSTQQILLGNAATPGIAIGPALVCSATGRTQRGKKNTSATEPTEVYDTAREIERLNAALTTIDAALVSAAAQLKDEGQAADAHTFHVHHMLLADPSLRERAIALIAESGWRAADAIVQAGAEQIGLLEAADHPEMRARAAGVQAGISQVWRMLVENTTVAERLKQPSIVVTDHIGPAELMKLPRENLLGLALAHGGLTAHAAILVRAWNIPVVTGLGDTLLRKISDGVMLGLDALHGKLIVDPEVDTVLELREIADELSRHHRELLTQRDQDTVTRDGQHIALFANVSSQTGAQAAREWGAAGIGSLRTELLLLGRAGLPNEDEQVDIYLGVAAELPGLPIIARTLDLGGDKQLPLFPLPSEENPFLGWRGIRIGLTHPEELLLPQLRAMLRAGAVADIRIIMPMIATLSEWRQVRALVERARSELEAEGLPCPANPQVGVLIEVPSAALIIDQLAREADFISIGSNDLVQYTLACDRTNPRIAHLYQPLEPSILHLFHTISEVAHHYGHKVSLCGEIASDPRLTMLLIGLGIDELSCTPPALPAVRAAIRSTNAREARQLAHAALQLTTSDEVHALLERGLATGHTTNATSMRRLSQAIPPETA